MVGEDYIEKLKSSRSVTAVLKHDLINLRNHSPEIPILIFEGPDDKLIYFQWISRVINGFKYEAFICNGKGKLLKFRDMLSKDLGTIKDNLFYFIDRDFDDMAGYTPGNDIFMTDMYAVENYLVNKSVLDEILKNELQCHAAPSIRKEIITLFDRVYKNFLEVTSEINFRIFFSRRKNHELQYNIQEKIQEIVKISLHTVEPHSNSACDIIVYKEEPDAVAFKEMKKEFDSLIPSERYRGKYAYAFFIYWLKLLCEDYTSKPSVYFSKLTHTIKARQSEITTLNGLASKSELPKGFDDFISRIASPISSS